MSFYDGTTFHPERWLPKDHARYDTQFDQDTLDAVRPFSQGPRSCPGKEIALWQIRIFSAKVLWAFDIEALQGFEMPNLPLDLLAFGVYEKPDIPIRFSSRV